MIKLKYVAFAIELAGAAAIVAATYMLLNVAASLLAAGVIAILLGAALENNSQ